MTHRSTILGLVAALACTAASPAPVAKAFGNTILMTYPDGRTGELWLAPDGGYTALGRRHDPSSGHWTVKAAKLCLKQSRPIPVFFSFCTPLPSSGITTAWAGKAPTGEAILISLVNGRVTGG